MKLLDNPKAVVGLIYKTLSVSVVGLYALLASGCGQDNPPTPVEPDKPIPENLHLGRYLPPLDFGQSEQGLATWLKKHKAEEKERNGDSITYTLPSDSLPALRLIFVGGEYREARQTVGNKGVTSDARYLDFLSQSGFVALENNRWVHKDNPALCLDMGNVPTLENIQIYEAYRKVDFKIPFVGFGDEITRKALREKLAKEGYEYDSEASSSYKQVFRTPMKHFPVMDIYFDRQTERPKQTVLHADSKYSIRSPHLLELLKQADYQLEPGANPLYPVLTNAGLGIRVNVSVPNAFSHDTGIVSFETYNNPNQPVEITEIPFPTFEFGQTWEEIEAFEKGRGNKTTNFMDVLNASLNDPYFAVHGYYFDTKQNPKTYYMAVTLVRNNTIISSLKFRQLMEAEGFDFFKEEKGKTTYFHRSKPIIATTNANDRPHSITYRKYP